MRLHRELPHSELTVVPGSGHMVHYAEPGKIVAAIDRAFLKARLHAETVVAPVAADVPGRAASQDEPLELAA